MEITPADDALVPGFMVVHGNQPESLRDLVVAWMQRYPLAPLENELVLVQSNGIAQWLRLSLAAHPGQGGIGIAAALDLQLPSAALWSLYRAVLGRAEVPPASAFDKPLLVWRLMRLLPALLDQPAFAPLRRFLQQDEDGRKRHQLAIRLSDLLDQYQVYRVDWLSAWAAGDDVLLKSGGARVGVGEAVRWQPALWRALLADVGEQGAATSRAQVHQRFMAAVQGWQGAAPAGLPRRITVFGISSLPRQAIEVLSAVARWSQVLLCVHNPCEHDWSMIVAEQDLHRSRRQRRRPGLRGEPDSESLHLQAQPLLAAWGKQGRDFIRLLDDHDQPDAYEARFTAIGQRVDCFEPNGQDTLLRQLQDDIRELRPLAETRDRWPAVDPRQDRSLVFHVAHGPQREVELLHDQLLEAFTADPGLRPRDVIVMVPDVSAYAAHIQAVFGLVERGDPRHIPFTIVDHGQRGQDPLLSALEALLGLPDARLAAGDVLDLLQVPALRARFGLAEDDLPLVRQWLEGAGIRWGLHAAHRRSLALPDGLEQNSWSAGLRRLMLGYAVGEGAPWKGIEPMPEVGGLEAALLGPLVRLADALEAHWAALQEPAPPEAWAVRLESLLADFFQADDGSADGLTLLRARSALQEWREACAAAALQEPLPLSVVREHWLECLEPQGLRQAFFAGGVTFASLMPMRAIPFRRVALLGMNDGDYPRSRTPMDFDLMAGDHRPGDRSRREDDRYLFLEALLSARDHLHVSWVGRSIHDNEPRPPSVLVAQLRDHVAAGWRLQDTDVTDATDAGRALLRAITVEHRLQPFHPAYFDGSDPALFSHAREWRASLAGGPVTAAGHELPPQPATPLTLKRMGDFLRNPARAFLEQRLGVAFRQADPVAQDEEPFTLDALDNWKLQSELIRIQKAAVDAGTSREEALASQLARIARRGELPHGAFARQVLQELAEPMDRLFALYARALRDWPRERQDEPLEWRGGTADAPLVLDDWLTGLRADAQGRRARLVLEHSGIVHARTRSWRFDRLMPHWVAHLAGQLAGEPLTTLVLSKAGSVTLQPLTALEASVGWNAMLAAMQDGMRRPLPFELQAAAAWLKCMEPRSGREPAPDAAQKARDAAEASFREQRTRDESLARAHPDFESLWSGGAFVHWTGELLRPLREQLGQAPRDDGEGADA